MFSLVTALIAAAGLLLSTAVHVSTFLGVDPWELSALPLRHIGAIAVGIPAIIAAKRKHGRPAEGSFAGLFPGAPRWMILATAMLFAYAILDGAIHLRLAPFSGGPDRLGDGTFAITNKGTFVRPISEADFHRYRAYEARDSPRGG
jgi:hypothetical protein